MQDLCPINKASVNKQSLTTFIMIRKNSLFCKIFRTKTSSKFIFDSYYDISVNLLRKWLSLWHIHKQHWLGALTDMETSSTSFMQYLAALESYPAYSMEFVRQTSHSFLQCHKNPILKNPKNARYHQQIFLPDYSIN